MYIQSSTLAAARVGFDRIFQQAYNSVAQVDLWYQMLATERPSSLPANLYHFLALFPRLREWVGPRQLNNLKMNDYLLKNKNYEGSFNISVNDFEDDNLGAYDAAIQNLGRSAKLWPNDLIYTAIVNGGASLCYDGQYFFDTDHPLEVPGATATTQANLHTSTSLTAANFKTVRQLMRVRKGEDGKPLGILPDLLVVPAALEFTAKQIIEADIAGYLQNNSSQASDSNVAKNLCKVLVIPELDTDSATTWYLADTTKPLKPFIFQLRRAPNRVDVLARPTDKDYFDNLEIKVGVDGRGAPGYGLWQLMDKCTA